MHVIPRKFAELHEIQPRVKNYVSALSAHRTTVNNTDVHRSGVFLFSFLGIFYLCRRVEALDYSSSSSSFGQTLFLFELVCFDAEGSCAH